MLPLDVDPQKSFVCMSAINVGLDGLGIGMILSVPIPRLLICLKFKVINHLAVPATGIKIPSS
jgi:hypothetical protein